MYCSKPPEPLLKGLLPLPPLLLEYGLPSYGLPPPELPGGPYCCAIAYDAVEDCQMNRGRRVLMGRLLTDCEHECGG